MKDSIAKSREVTAPEIIFDQPLVTSSLSARPAIWWMTMGWEVLSTQWTILEHDSLSFLGTSAVALSQPRSREVQLPVTSIHWCAIFNPRSPLQKEKAVTRSLMLSTKMMRRSQRRFESRPNSASSLLKFG